MIKKYQPFLLLLLMLLSIGLLYGCSTLEPTDLSNNKTSMAPGLKNTLSTLHTNLKDK